MFLDRELEECIIRKLKMEFSLDSWNLRGIVLKFGREGGVDRSFLLITFNFFHGLYLRTKI